LVEFSAFKLILALRYKAGLACDTHFANACPAILVKDLVFAIIVPP
jgi:hypothetical protein